jgi:hypothetical protein
MISRLSIFTEEEDIHKIFGLQNLYNILSLPKQKLKLENDINRLSSMVFVYTAYCGILKLCVVLTECICAFHMVLTENSNYYPWFP